MSAGWFDRAGRPLERPLESWVPPSNSLELKMPSPLSTQPTPSFFAGAIGGPTPRDNLGYSPGYAGTDPWVEQRMQAPPHQSLMMGGSGMRAMQGEHGVQGPLDRMQRMDSAPSAQHQNNMMMRDIAYPNPPQPVAFPNPPQPCHSHPGDVVMQLVAVPMGVQPPQGSIPVAAGDSALGLPVMHGMASGPPPGARIIAVPAGVAPPAGAIPVGAEQMGAGFPVTPSSGLDANAAFPGASLQSGRRSWGPPTDPHAGLGTGVPFPNDAPPPSTNDFRWRDSEASLGASGDFPGGAELSSSTSPGSWAAPGGREVGAGPSQRQPKERSGAWKITDPRTGVQVKGPSRGPRALRIVNPKTGEDVVTVGSGLPGRTGKL